ncbi:MAG: GAF domain-containing protein [Oscillatoriaceae bacterium SKW80]|nr:GAF domain-containing protein [Oscillatoriaceae bacterium SKYG93]MCX8120961.1 GAF domain-containing protein [Oscillatoriaceae bacterium SKW80]MDW8452234.1 GAF domain-containing protein [Oscillatoriaceae cyanobacterium SKYGB_i_bin93]HIK26569.1 GAF domain-containing protein [Oscillatoriaceae cyanobacterium M7585_C2015_266]
MQLTECQTPERELIAFLQAANQQLKEEIDFRLHAEIDMRQKAEQAQLMTAVSQYVRQFLNLKECLKKIVAEVRQFLQADRVLIYRLSTEQVGSVVAESAAAGCLSMLGFVMREFGAVNENSLEDYCLGHIQAIENIRTADMAEERIKLLEFFNIKSMLVVPLIVRDEKEAANNANNWQNSFPYSCFFSHSSNLWGLMVVHQCSCTRKWKSFEIDAISSVAGLVEIAIQQDQLFDTVQKLNAALEYQIEEHTAQLFKLNFETILKRISNKLRDSLDENQILQTVVQELGIALSLKTCNSAIYSPEKKTAIICSEYTTSSRTSLGQVVQMSDNPELYRQLLQGQHFQFCECILNPNQKPSAILAYPIFYDKEIIGDLWLFKSAEEKFSEIEIQLVQLVASQCALAIRQARLYQAEKLQVEEFTRLNLLKDDFLSTISHELRTPLANMKMALQMLAIALNQERAFFAEFSKPEEERSKVARYFQIVRNECEREIRLIEDLLDLQKFDSKSNRWAKGIIDLPHVLPKIVQSFQQQTQKKQQELLLDMPGDLPALVGNPFIFKRILTELLTNACKYTPSGEKIIIKARSEDERVYLSFTNTGVEIPPEELQQIFNKFYRIPKANRWQQGGTGLGLAVVQKLTEEMGGSIEVASTTSQTYFKLNLPLNAPSIVNNCS